MTWLIRSLIAFGAAAFLYLTGATNPVEHELVDTRFRMLQRPATGGLVVVAIDPKSLAELDRWPWPRTLHAQMLQKLVAAGARTIALDIDFSSRSTAPNDLALAEAIAAAGSRIVLPLFRQTATGPARDGGPMHVTRPRPAIGAKARLASVTVRPEPDGLVRRALMGEYIEGTDYPSLAAALAGTSGEGGPFLIDYGIAASTIPTLSFADVLAGRFDPAAIAGKTVIVGATAVELGDRLAVPIYRSLPGPLVQGLAYESIVQGRAIHGVQRWAVLGVALVLALALGPLFTRRSWRWGAAAVLVVAAGSFASALAVQARWPVSVAVTPWILTALFGFAVNLVGELERQARELFLQGMEVLSKGAMLRGVVEDSFDGIAITDERGIVEMFNASAGRMLGRSPDDVAGLHIASVLPLPAELGATLATRGEIPDRFDAPWEIELGEEGGSPLAVELVVSTSTVRQARGRRRSVQEPRRILIFTFRDVSERRRALAAQVAATDEAMAASRAKSEFLTNMSHELRTPLNAIIGFSEMLCEQVFGPVGDRHYLDYAKDIHASGEHLRDLVNDILDVSKIEAGKLEISEEAIDLTRIAESCMRIVAGRADARGIRMRLEAPPAGKARLTGDQRMVKQSLLNLLSNAVKFTPEGGSVTVTISPEGNGGLAASVRDTGVGIAAEHLPRLGEPFYQVDGTLSRTHEGTGLGLYLVTRFITLHDGSVDIDSTPGAGTEVTLHFPAARRFDPGMSAAA